MRFYRYLIHNNYACKGVFNPNIPIFPPNFAEGLHFSAFHLNGTALQLLLHLIYLAIIIVDIGLVCVIDVCIICTINIYGSNFSISQIFIIHF